MIPPPAPRTFPALLLLAGLLLFLPGLTSLPPFDRDEARFAQASRQMIESGDYIRLRFQNEARNKKPVGIYWLQAGAARAAVALGLARPDEIWPYRLPSVFGALAAVLLTYGVAARLADPAVALSAGLLTAAALQTVLEAHLAKTDAMLLATAVLAQGTLGRFYVAARRDEPPPGSAAALAFWAAQGVAILLKGPVIPLVTLLTIGALAICDRGRAASLSWLKALRPWAGIPLMALIVLPWFVAISSTSGGGFVGEAIRHDVLPKLLGGQESHGAPPGMYLLLFPLIFWPASLPAFFGVIRAWARRTAPVERFLLCWIGPAWLMFELIPTKLPHYVLPLWPALAILGALWLHERGEGTLTWPKKAFLLLWSLVGLALAGGIVAGPWLLDHRIDSWSLAPAWAALVTAVGGALWVLARRTPVQAAALAGAAFLVFTPLLAAVLPASHAFWLSRSLADATRRQVPDGAPLPPMASAGDGEPSLVFLLGTDLLLTDGAGAAKFLALHGNGLAWVATSEEPGFRAGAAAAGFTPLPRDLVRGFNYSRGKWLTVTLYGRAP